MMYSLCISKDGQIIVRLGVTADEALAIVRRANPKTAEVIALDQKSEDQKVETGKETQELNDLYDDLDNGWFRQSGGSRDRSEL